MILASSRTTSSWVKLYTVPAGKQALLTISCVNTDFAASPDSLVNISLTPTTSAPSIEHIFDIEKKIVERDKILLTASNSIWIKCDDGDTFSATVFGLVEDIT